MDLLKQLDLGCGSQPRQEDGYKAVGVDIAPCDNPAVEQVDFALKPLPYKTDSFDLVTAHQVLEHIPKMIYVPYWSHTFAASKSKSEITDYGRRNCLIELFNEVYRVLKHDGKFIFDVPLAGTTQYYGDPTHVTEWTPDSVNYYSGDYFGFHDDYGHTSKFKKLRIDIDPQRDWHMTVELQAIKPAEWPYNV